MDTMNWLPNRESNTDVYSHDVMMVLTAKNQGPIKIMGHLHRGLPPHAHTIVLRTAFLQFPRGIHVYI